MTAEGNPDSDTSRKDELLVFVYGTLRKRMNGGAGWNHAHYLAPLEPVALVEIPGYQLVYWGELRGRNENNFAISRAARRDYAPEHGVPVMTPKADGSVVGELYLVDKNRLRRIDGLEGVNEKGIGGIYRRVEIEVVLNGDVVKALAYVGVRNSIT